MKSIYLRNFVATAIMVSICFLIIAFAFVGIGRSIVISDSREKKKSKKLLAAAVKEEEKGQENDEPL